jgi:hypothetical protein
MFVVGSGARRGRLAQVQENDKPVLIYSTYPSPEAAEAQVLRRSAQDGEYDERRIGVAVARLHRLDYLPGQALPRLDDHHRLAAARQDAFPTIN